MKYFLSIIGCLFLCTIAAVSTVQATSAGSLNSYSLSFAPIHNWWPTASNSVQQIDAAIWKDSDGENVKNFTDLKAEWKFDPDYYQMQDTASSYFPQCPIETVGKRPCIKFSVHVTTLKPGKTNVQLTVSSVDRGQVWNAETAEITGNSESHPTATPNPSGLSKYSLSFESDPIRKWWPLAANHFEGIAAALWKDGDGENVQRFTNLQAEWQFDPQYFTVANTSSKYFKTCPIASVGQRPCIYFYATVRPLRAGNTSVQLKTKDGSGEEAWNAYPVVIDDVSITPSPIASPVPSAPPSARPTTMPIPSGSEYKNLEQKVVMLENKVQEQEVKLTKTQGILEKIVSFLKNLFRFNSQ